MECKNCSNPLPTPYNYCPHCGAKVIRNRLTFKNLGAEFAERFLNLDNTFWHTFRHLFHKPDVVVEAYLSGIRKRYLDPLSYLGISLALSGFLFFVLTRYYMEDVNLDVFGTGMSTETSQKILALTTDFSSFIFLLYIPVMALTGWLTYNQKQYLLPEHIIVAVYSLAHYNIFAFPFSLLILIFIPETYFSLTFFFTAAMVGYSLFVINTLNNLPTSQRIIRSIAYLALFGIGYLGISIGMNLVFLLTGDLSLQDFIPRRS